MNKDIRKYIANCILCRRDKAKVQQYPLQMTEIPDRPFDKIAIDLVTDCEPSTSGNKHILTIIDHLTGWPEAFPHPRQFCWHHSCYTYKPLFASAHVLQIHSIRKRDMEFKNNLLDQVLQQLGIDRIFSAPYNPQSNSKLEVFHKYLKPTLKKLCEKDPASWDKYINQVLRKLQDHTQPGYCRITIFFGLWQGPQSATYTNSWNQCNIFLGDPDSGKLHLETHRLALADC